MLIEKLHLRGKNEYEITDLLNSQRPYHLTREQIHYDLTSIATQWRAEYQRDRAEAIAKELASLQTLQAEHWQAWERTLEEKTRTRTEQSTNDGGTGDGDGKDRGRKAAKASVEKEDMLGNPAYLAGVMACIERRCKLLGLDAPTKIAPTDPTGERAYGDADHFAALTAQAKVKASALAAEAEAAWNPASDAN